MTNAMIIEPLAMSSISASNTASGYDAGYLDNDFIGVVWRSESGLSSVTVTVDMGSDVAFDTACLIGCVGAQAGWTLQVKIAAAAQGSGFAGAWTGSTEAFLAGTVSPRNGRCKALWMAPSGAPAVGRYIRFTIASLSGMPVTIGRIVIGQKIQLARNFSFGAALGVNALGNVDFSVNGVPLRRRGSKMRAIGISFGHVHRDEVEDKVQPLLEASGNDTPVMVITDPDAHAQRQSRMYFGFLVGNIGTVWARPNGFQAQINLVAID
ncbi:hypothetical protein [Sphingorhabdus sp. 109]|uniref:hypothetical protein n=1 Tax=Sphingorhabdus sp. 109 TaxID=2653173 RepID=UPI0012F46D15|nr:hypothetical protein [Sphingorhabdus sp. 109]VWX56727.1 conserved hypothetical protein [Sphingorhabdus sp. 109]